MQSGCLDHHSPGFDDSAHRFLPQRHERGHLVSNWEAVGATALGSAHVRNGLPNQDSVSVRALKNGTVAAVADGHGGARYVRSDRGSRFATEIAIALGSELVTSGRLAGCATSDEAAALIDTVTHELSTRWLESVHADQSREDFTAQEGIRAGVNLGLDPAIAYGSTVLFAVASGEWLCLAQLGDGDIIVVSSEGEVLSPIPADPRLVAGQTTSLSLSSAVDDFRTQVLGVAESELVVLATDGYGNSFADNRWREQVAGDLARDARTRGLATLEGDLPEWLGESAEAGGDDVSVALLQNRTVSLTPRPTATPPKSTLRTDNEPATNSPSAPSPSSLGTETGSGASPAPKPTRIPVVLLLGLTLVIVAGFLGFALGHRSSRQESDNTARTTESPDDTSPTSTPPTTSVQVSAAPIKVSIGAGEFSVEFNPDTSQPSAQRSPVAIPAISVMELSNGQKWSVSPSWTLRVLERGRSRTLDLGGVPIAGLANTGSTIWAVSRDGSALFSTDQQSFEVKRFSVVEIGVGGPAPEGPGS